MERVAGEDGIRKLGHRDLPLAVAAGTSGATTVSATARLAALAGIGCSPPEGSAACTGSGR
ncbi:hypothetical protein GCM10023238_15920 [Streptomyces heliomycini]